MIYRHLLLIVLCFLSFKIVADIGVSPIIVDLVGHEADAEIAVKNFDPKHSAYVEITAYRLTDPANPKAPKLRVRHPKQDGLLVFPAKLVLLPGQTQFVRVVKAYESVLTDKVYEIDIIPKTATKLISEQENPAVKLGIRVIIGYGVRITLRPENPKPALTIKRQNHHLVISNIGNTSLAIVSCTQLVAGKKKEIALPAYTLFAGQSITKELTQPSKVTLDAVFLGKSLGLFYTN